jgi:hypothetical protein
MNTSLLEGGDQPLRVSVQLRELGTSHERDSKRAHWRCPNVERISSYASNIDHLL